MCSYSHLSASDSDRPKQTLLAHQAGTSGCAPYDAPHSLFSASARGGAAASLLHISYHQSRILAPPHSWEVAPATFGIMWKTASPSTCISRCQTFVCHSQRRGQACAQTVVKRDSRQMLALANMVASRNPATLCPFLTSRAQEEGPTIKAATSRGMV